MHGHSSIKKAAKLASAKEVAKAAVAKTKTIIYTKKKYLLQKNSCHILLRRTHYSKE